MIGICNLCLKKKALCKAHIIPYCFFKYIYNYHKNSQSLVQYDNIHKFKKRSPIGWYDKSMLCSECDGLFSSDESYAKEILLNDDKLEILHPNLAYIIREPNCISLLNFFVAIMWKASISKLPEFSRISLGPYQDRLRNYILTKNSSFLNNFSVILSKMEGKKFNSVAKNHIALPYKDRINGLNYWILYLTNGYKIFIKLDKRNDHIDFRHFIIGRYKDVCVLKLDNFDQSIELHNLKYVIDNCQN